MFEDAIARHHTVKGTIINLHKTPCHYAVTMQTGDVLHQLPVFTTFDAAHTAYWLLIDEIRIAEHSA